MRYTRGGLKFNVFTNILNGDASGLLAVGTNGQPIPFTFNTQSYDIELGNINTLGTRNVLSYGGNVRFNNFDLSIAPRGDNRTELGAYVQDEMFLNNYVRLNLGARLDKFGSIDDPVFSPRVALILKPTADQAIRVSFNKAFRAPSLVNNYLETTIINQLNLGLINPALAGVTYNFPVRAIGNESLTEESTQSFEVAYTGIINNRATVSAAVYFTTNEDEIFFTQTGTLPRRGAAAGLAAARGGARSAAAALRAGRGVHHRRFAVGVQLPQSRHGEEQGRRARHRRRGESRVEPLRQLLVAG